MVVEEEETIYNPKDVLETLPGVNPINIQKILSSVKNLHELSQMTLKEMENLLGVGSGKQLHDFFNNSIETTTTTTTTTK